MKRLVILAGMALLCVPGVYAQGEFDHINVGVFADYFRSNATATNMFGVGGRVGVAVFPRVKLEGEMAYDFQRIYEHQRGNSNAREHRRAHAARIVWAETGRDTRISGLFCS
jgi:hypothetical protein